VEVIQNTDKSCRIYHLGKAGVLDTLYHPSYMISVALTHEVLGLANVFDEWSGLPRIKERQAAASMSIVLWSRKKSRVSLQNWHLPYWNVCLY
jgi:hypothetical protein